jgi:hypothetical protein
MKPQKQTIPEPKIAAPPVAAAVARAAEVTDARAQLAPALAVVPPPRPVVQLRADRIALENCTIERPEYFWIFPGTPRGTQTKSITPARAEIMHGVIVVDELNLILPLEGTIIRS